MRGTGRGSPGRLAPGGGAARPPREAQAQAGGGSVPWSSLDAAPGSGSPLEAHHSPSGLSVFIVASKGRPRASRAKANILAGGTPGRGGASRQGGL